MKEVKEQTSIGAIKVSKKKGNVEKYLTQCGFQ